MAEPSLFPACQPESQNSQQAAAFLPGNGKSMARKACNEGVSGSCLFLGTTDRQSCPAQSRARARHDFPFPGKEKGCEVCVPSLWSHGQSMQGRKAYQSCFPGVMHHMDECTSIMSRGLISMATSSSLRYLAKSSRQEQVSQFKLDL